MKDNLDVQILSLMIPATISFVFFIALTVRLTKIRVTFRISKIKVNESMLFRISLLIINIAAEITCLFLAQYYNEYVFYKDSLIYLICLNALTFLMQIYVMIKEYTIKVPLFVGHKVFWIAQWFLIVLNALALFLEKIDDLSNYAVVGLRFISFTTLLIYTLIIRKQDHIEFENIGFWTNRIPDYQNKALELQRSRFSTVGGVFDASENQIIKIDIGKTWNIVDDELEFKMDIILFHKGIQFITKRTVHQLLSFHQQLITDCQDFLDSNTIILQELTFHINSIQESQGQNVITFISKYFQIITSKQELLTNGLLDFANVLPEDKLLIFENNKQSYAAQSKQNSEVFQISQLQSKGDIKSEYLPYFDVKITDHQIVSKESQTFVQYQLHLMFTRDQQILWTIQKRYTDFYELHETLKQFLGLKIMPPFPGKKLISLDEGDIQQRKMDLEIFLKVVLNDRIYHHYSLFNFIGLTKEQVKRVEKIQEQVKFECSMISKLNIQSLGFDEQHDNQHNKYFRYVYQVSAKTSKYIIQKRFTQFDDLNQMIKIRFSAMGEQHLLPNFPIKFAQLQKQINPNARVTQLTQYLQQLLKVPLIGESIYFRQFMEIRVQDNQAEDGVRPQAMSVQSLEQIFKQLDETDLKDSSRLEQIKSKWN
ncbi:hypothetical protein pb186bvf_004180 [Paramecium bursaria]